MIESVLYDQLPGHKVRCNVCAVRCLIPEGKEGICRTRVNRGGVLFSLIYNRVSSVACDPIEKKPLFHFYPATRILSLGTVGCNFRCPGCQNWKISHAEVDEQGTGTDFLKTEDTIALMRRYGCEGICWTYNDPTIWLEYTLDCAKLAKAHGYYTAYITNGYTTPEALDLIGPYLDAFRVDLKGITPATYTRIAGLGRPEKIIEMTVRAKTRWGMHVECVTNVTPTVNDSPEELRRMARAIKTHLGPETPWHITRFFPYLDLSHLRATPLSKLEEAYQIARSEGLQYVYIGNVPGHPMENTYCDHCHRRLVLRDGFRVVENRIVGGRCPDCGVAVPGRFSRPQPTRVDPARFPVRA
jgi:pyruvate formate lyase activating enzyme